MADRITISIKNPIGPALRKLPREVQEAIDKVVADTSEKLFNRIVTDTPRDRGQGGGAVSRWTRTVQAAQALIKNDAPHINVLEFGGYPVRAIKGRTLASGVGGFQRGNAVLGGLSPGPRTQIAPGGSPTMISNVSRQAPQGMVRQNLERITAPFVFDLEEAIDKAFEDIAESS